MAPPRPSKPRTRALRTASAHPRKTRKPGARERRGVARPVTLAIDVGGSHIKAALLGATGHLVSERLRLATPDPLTPKKLLATLVDVAEALDAHDRVSVGINGLVHDGRIYAIPVTANPAFRRLRPRGEVPTPHPPSGAHPQRRADARPRLHSRPRGGDGDHPRHRPRLRPVHRRQARAARPVPVRRRRRGAARAATTAISPCQALGRKKWSRRVERLIDLLRRLTNFDHLYIGGGNARKLKIDLPRDVYPRRQLGRPPGRGADVGMGRGLTDAVPGPGRRLRRHARPSRAPSTTPRSPPSSGSAPPGGGSSSSPDASCRASSGPSRTPSLFDLVVAENGGLLYEPATGRERALAEPPPETLVSALRAAGADPHLRRARRRGHRRAASRRGPGSDPSPRPRAQGRLQQGSGDAPARRRRQGVGTGGGPARARPGLAVCGRRRRCGERSCAPAAVRIRLRGCERLARSEGARALRHPGRARRRHLRAHRAARDERSCRAWAASRPPCPRPGPSARTSTWCPTPSFAGRDA